MYYDQRAGPTSLSVDGNTITFPPPSLDLAFNDSVLDPVHDAWKVLMGSGAEDEDIEYLKFEDREGADDDDDAYE